MFKDNYKYLLEKSGRNYSDVARFLKISTTAARAYYEEGSTPRQKNMERLATMFNVPIADLQHGDVTGAEVPAISMGMNIPLLKLSEIVDYLDGKLSSPSSFHCSYDVDSDAYAVVQEGDSMQSSDNQASISDGTMVVIEPNFNSASNRIVLARLKSKNIFVIKKYQEDAGSAFLVSLNPIFGVIPVTEDIEIVGVAKLAVKEHIL